MSVAASALRADPRTAPSRSPRRAAQLRVVGAPQRRHHSALVVGCVAAIITGLTTLLMLTVSLERGAYESRGLENQAVRLSEQRQALQEDIEARTAPEVLANSARKLGMVNASRVGVLRGDGKVLALSRATGGATGGAVAAKTKAAATDSKDVAAAAAKKSAAAIKTDAIAKAATVNSATTQPGASVVKPKAATSPAPAASKPATSARPKAPARPAAAKAA